MIVDRYSREDTPERLVEWLRQAQVEDAVAEAGGSKYTCSAALFIVAAIVMAVIGCSLPPGSGGGVTGLFAAAGVAIVLGFFLVYKSWYWTRRDLDNHKLSIPMRFLRIIRTDMAPHAKIRLDLDFFGYYDSDYRQPDGSYHQHWMALKTRLSDGNVVFLDVEWTIKRREIPKHRGTRVKERLRDTITLSVRLDLARYGACEPVLPLLQSIRPPHPLHLAWVRGQGAEVTVKLVTDVKLRSGRDQTSRAQDGLQVSADTLLALLVWFYRALHEARGGVPVGEPTAPPLSAPGA